MIPDMIGNLTETVWSRRQALCFGIGGLGALLLPKTASAKGDVFEWTGTALGAPARILIAHDDRKAAQRAVHNAVMELDRIEDQFSLYRDTSALSRLNRDGELVDPSMDMRTLISLSRIVSMRSNGAFDISIQPLWKFLANHFSQNPTPDRSPDPEVLGNIQRHVDYRRIKISDRRITLGHGMSLTLNGIAQGYATDLVAHALRLSGFPDVLVELGEAYGAGNRAPSTPWRLGIRETGTKQQVVLRRKALAVSSGGGTLLNPLVLNPDNGYSHIIDPYTGAPISRRKTVYVTHTSATIADALSTTLCLIPTKRAAHLIAHFPGAEAFEIMQDGDITSLG